MTDNVISFCNDLLAFEYVAMDGYKAAIEGTQTDHADIATTLREYLGDHERHVRELKGHVRAAGGEPRDMPGAKIAYKKPMMELRKLAGSGPVVSGMVNNETEAVRTYEEAVQDATEQALPHDIIDTCRRALEDERRHLAFCKQSVDRIKAAGGKKGAGEPGARRGRPQRGETRGYGGST